MTSQVFLLVDLFVLGHKPHGGLGSGTMSVWVLQQLPMRMKPVPQEG